MARKCSECAFSRLKEEKLPVGGQYECRRKPPLIHPSADYTNGFGAWPLVHGVDWCGEFRPPRPSE